MSFVLLSDNRLSSFPLEFCDLKHLDVLNLSKNKITEAPKGIGKLQVVELNLNQNQVFAFICSSSTAISRNPTFRFDCCQTIWPCVPG